MHGLFFIILLIYFIKMLLTNEHAPVVESGEPCRLIPDPCNNIEHIVNGRTITVGHQYYYMTILGIFNQEDITDKSIRQAYCKKFDEKRMKSQTETGVIDDSSIRAAKYYMIERWMYVAFQN